VSEKPAAARPDIHCRIHALRLVLPPSPASADKPHTTALLKMRIVVVPVIRVPSSDKSGHDPMDESNFAPHGGFVDGNVRVRL
jgi:hypothetical protein